MDRYRPLYPQIVMCLYDLDRLGGALIELVMTHTRMLVGGMAIENPYCLTPEEVLAKKVQRGAATATRVSKEAEKWHSDVITGST
jgi:hypothetical protein